MTPAAHFALVSRTNRVSFAELQRIAASVDAQLKEDFFPIWQRRADIVAFAHEKDVPLGMWRIFIEEDIGQPGALGYHTDEHNQPVAYVAYQADLNDLCVTVSHEALETVADPFGNRLIVALHPTQNRKVRILCEVCDPSEARTYVKLGLEVSDFYYPEWFDEKRTPGLRYSFMGALPGPRLIIQGGYMSFIDTDNRWRQLTWFRGNAPVLTGPLNWQLNDGQSLREMVDANVNALKAELAPE